jgi:anthranilate synthase/aminodeoxychorismate synthase-like glutamine amidotransferase
MLNSNKISRGLRMKKILFIDNFDSFTYNLVDEFEKRNCTVKVYRNNIKLDSIEKIITEFKPNLLVISPGPSAPKDAGICLELIKKYSGILPIFGVCLGHQCIVEAFNGKVGRCPETLHGKPSLVEHNSKDIFQNIENPFQVGRYHSLHAESLPQSLETTAKTNDIVMAVKHKEHNTFGVQFHPESILTPAGRIIIDNILNLI